MVSFVPHSKCDTVVVRAGAELLPTDADFQGSEDAKRFFWSACGGAVRDFTENGFNKELWRGFPAELLVERKSPQ
jgi:hypothetical protein